METWVCGLDEAGRGPLAGPIVAAAVVFPADFDFNAHFLGVALRDSNYLIVETEIKALFVLFMAHPCFV